MDGYGRGDECSPLGLDLPEDFPKTVTKVPKDELSEHDQSPNGDHTCTRNSSKRNKEQRNFSSRMKEIILTKLSLEKGNVSLFFNDIDKACPPRS